MIFIVCKRDIVRCGEEEGWPAAVRGTWRFNKILFKTRKKNNPLLLGSSGLGGGGAGRLTNGLGSGGAAGLGGSRLGASSGRGALTLQERCEKRAVGWSTFDRGRDQETKR
jgi:hypothetical protein